jgi:predicted ATPase/class 3 adenylate cyclase
VSQPPSGTVTFLFTDIEGSTRSWEERPEVMRPSLALHDELLRGTVEAHGGHVVKSTGDGVFAVFAVAHDGVGAAIAAQLALVDADWPADEALRVRMGLHVGAATMQYGDYFGADVNRAARLMSVAHGGQIVCSGPVGDLVRGRFALTDLGEHRLRDLQSSVHVFQVDAPGLCSSFPPLRSLDALAGNLPSQPTRFIGREAQIASLTELVPRSPLVTLTGVGGVGKTRLALQVAAEVATDFRDGAWFCEFAPLADPGQVWEMLAACLRVRAFPGRTLEESVLEYLAPKRLLLVLDNCEHLLGAIARLVAAITRRCARVSVVATSREGLALAGERMVAVPSLGVPTDDTDLPALVAADAVQLFSDRATAARNDFVLTDRNARAIGVLCRRLDGIPLAIELAAARVRSLSPDDLVARLDQRFKLLTRGSRAALERHQTLRSTIDWSYDLLDPIERGALDRLSVFAGSYDLTAAEAVIASDTLDASDVIDVLGQLVDKSLVVADDNDGVRYWLLESIRQYAQERLQAGGDTAAVRRRHAEHYVELAETGGPHLRSPHQVEWAAVVARDIDNFRVALDWAVETPSPEHALRLVAPFTIRGTAIGDAAKDWAETASTVPGADAQKLFPAVAAYASLAATFAGDFERAEARVTAAARVQARLGAGLERVLCARTILAFYRGDGEQARQHADAWVEHARESADTWDLVHALPVLASIVVADPDAAIAILDEAVQLARDAGFASALSICLTLLARMLPIEDSPRALALLDEAIEVGVEVGDRQGVAAVTGIKGQIAARRGDWRIALRAARDLAEQHAQLGDLADLYQMLLFAGIVFCALGDLETAAVLVGKGDALSDRRNLPGWHLEMLAHTDATLLAALGEKQVVTLAARGAALDSSAAVAYVRDQAEALLETG